MQAAAALLNARVHPSGVAVATIIIERTLCLADPIGQVLKQLGDSRFDDVEHPIHHQEQTIFAVQPRELVHPFFTKAAGRALSSQVAERAQWIAEVLRQEIDEVFVVVAGDATVEFVSPALDAVGLAPGAVVRLSAGMQTVWTVRETLRKIYLA